MKIDIVIGANYGDEGKGTVTATIVKNNKGKTLNVLTNGGPQRGHSILTVEYGNITHKHLGSGSVFGADTYFCSQFLVNPMQFAKEYKEFVNLTGIVPECYYHPFCVVTTPFDVIANQIELEQSQMNNSCGMGIWKTISRNNEIYFPKLASFLNGDEAFQTQYLLAVKAFYDQTIDWTNVPSYWKIIWEGTGLITNFIDDVRFFKEHCHLWSTEFEDDYDNIVYENGQGLLIGDSIVGSVYRTPSYTDATIALSLMPMFPESCSVHFVTRPYLTRHGDGPFNDLTMSNISSYIKDDRTNWYNQFQGEFRYSKLDLSDLQKRLLIEQAKLPATAEIVLDVTHCDEMDRILEFRQMFPNYRINFYSNPIV